MRAALAVAVVLALYGSGLASAAPDASTPAVEIADAGAMLGACDAIAARIERRMGWLAARRQEQFERGPVNPKKGVPNMVHVFCEAHPDDEDCLLGNAVIDAMSDDSVWSADAGVDEYEPHVLSMKRALRECREADRRVWP